MPPRFRAVIHPPSPQPEDRQRVSSTTRRDPVGSDRGSEPVQPAHPGTAPLSPAVVLGLQRTLGNRAVMQLLGSARPPSPVEMGPTGRARVPATHPTVQCLQRAGTQPARPVVRPDTVRDRLQRIKAYRVQDDDSERRRVVVDEDGNVTIHAPPLNISIGTPDHALYFIAERGYYDIVEFEIDDAFYERLSSAIESQGAKKRTPGAPTYNDPTKPGYKIEIPEGDWLEELKGNIVPNSGKVTAGAVFLEARSAGAFSRDVVFGFARQILGHKDKVATRQTVKALESYGIAVDVEASSFHEEEETDVDWKRLKGELWEINNNYFDKQLRGVK